MMLYHGSYVAIEKPDLAFSRLRTDFGRGFYRWLDFITSCRLGQPADAGWDLVIGGVANDKVFDILRLCFDGLIGADKAISRLRYNKPNFQYCFKTQSLIDGCLAFVGSEALG